MIDLPDGARRFVRIAGLTTLTLSALPALSSQAGLDVLGGSIPVLPPARFAAWMAAAVAFGLAFWCATAAARREHRRTWAGVLIAIQAAAMLTMFELHETGLDNTQVIVIAVQLGLFVPLGPALALALAQGLLQAWIAANYFSVERVVWFYGTLTVPSALLAVVAAHLMVRGTHIRLELARTNAELRATQVLVAEKGRVAERMRISRQLHDLLDHHLTALGGLLEEAGGGLCDKALAHVQRCQSVTTLLLADLRNAVGALRGEDTVDVARALAVLVDGALRPRIHLHVSPGLEMADPERAHTIVRCVQEVITNAVKHSDAANLWIELSTADGTLRLRVRDDGIGAVQITPGNGLCGMAERLEALGGRLRFAAEPGRGFWLEASLPS